MTTTIANANAGWPVSGLVAELEQALPLLLAKHRDLGLDLEPLAADLVLCLVFPNIRRTVLKAGEMP